MSPLPDQFPVQPTPAITEYTNQWTRPEPDQFLPGQELRRALDVLNHSHTARVRAAVNELQRSLDAVTMSVPTATERLIDFFRATDTALREVDHPGFAGGGIVGPEERIDLQTSDRMRTMIEDAFNRPAPRIRDLDESPDATDAPNYDQTLDDIDGALLSWLGPRS